MTKKIKDGQIGSMEFTLVSGETFKLPHNFLRGVEQTVILSKIKAFAVSTESPENLPLLLKIVSDAGLSFDKINAKDEAENKALEEYLAKNPELLIKSQQNQQNVEPNYSLLFEAVDLILSFFDISDVSSQDFDIDDSLLLIKYIQSNPRSKIPDFLMIQGVSLE